MKLIKKNEELQNDIAEVVTAVSSILMGIASVEDYPWEIVDKYSSVKPLKLILSKSLFHFETTFSVVANASFSVTLG